MMIRASSDSNTELNMEIFPNSLLPILEKVSKQTNAGTALIRRARTFFEKLSERYMGFSEDIKNLVELEFQNVGELEKSHMTDGMGSVWQTWSLILRQVQSVSLAHEKFATELKLNTGENLLNLEKVSHSLSSRVEKDIREVREHVEDMRDKTERLQARCTKKLLDIVSEVVEENEKVVVNSVQSENSPSSYHGASSINSISPQSALHGLNAKGKEFWKSKLPFTNVKSPQGSVVRIVNNRSSDSKSPVAFLGTSSKYLFKDIDFSRSLNRIKNLNSIVQPNQRRRIIKKLTRAKTLCQNYREEVDRVNVEIERYQKSTLSDALRNLGEIEKKRHNELQNQFILLSQIIKPLSESIYQASSSIDYGVNNMDFQKDVAGFVMQCLKDSKNLESQGTFSNVNYTISITAEDIEKQLRLIEADIEKMPQEQIQQMLESDSESKDSEDIDLDNNDVFGASLEDMMNLQINQGREVPVVFSWLIDMIYRTNGIRTEGIFRLPPEFTKTERLKRKIVHSTYNGIKESDFDHHVYGEVLKIWLRSLKDPLIPTNLYHKCITVGSKLIEESITSDNVSKFLSSPLISEYEYILSKMDHTRKAILNHLTVLLYDIVQGKSTTKMEIGALSIIFAPSLIRNPLNDPTVQFKNFKMESRFVDLLFVFVKDSISKDAHETNTFLRKNSTVGKKKSLFEPGRKTSIVRRQTTSEILDSSQLRLFETNDTNVSSSMGSSFTSKTSDLTDFIDSRKSEQLDRSPRKGSSGFWGKGT